jgi:hypothetical protein
MLERFYIKYSFNIDLKIRSQKSPQIIRFAGFFALHELRLFIARELHVNQTDYQYSRLAQ